MTKLIEFLTKGRNDGFALGAFNLDSLETLRAVALAAKELSAPVLVEVSEGEVDYLGIRNVASLVDNARREHDVPIFINLDHAENLDLIQQAIDFGFDLVHFDGSKFPPEENLAKAKQVVAWAHAKGVLVEGEMDHFPGSSSLNPQAGEVNLTDPEKAKNFVGETGVDIFSVSIGNKHGFYTDGSKQLHLDLLQKIREILPDQLFSLHGGSGTPEEQVQAAIKLGVVKVNINSELRIAWRQTLQKSLEENSTEYTWSKLAKTPIMEVQKVVVEKIHLFKSQGKIAI